MKKIIAINGSIRKQSSNGLLLNNLAEMFDEKNFIISDSISLLPHFTPDIDIPEVVLKFKKSLHSADYILIVTPEYAHGIPGVLKNALDWLVSDEELLGKDIIVMVCSAGSGDHAMLSIIETLKTTSFNVVPDRCVQVSSIRSKFVDDKLTDCKLRKRLKLLIDDLKCEDSILELDNFSF